MKKSKKKSNLFLVVITFIIGSGLFSWLFLKDFYRQYQNYNKVKDLSLSNYEDMAARDQDELVIFTGKISEDSNTVYDDLVCYDYYYYSPGRRQKRYWHVEEVVSPEFTAILNQQRITCIETYNILNHNTEYYPDYYYRYFGIIPDSIVTIFGIIDKIEDGNITIDPVDVSAGSFEDMKSFYKSYMLKIILKLFGAACFALIPISVHLYGRMKNRKKTDQNITQINQSQSQQSF